MLIKFTYEGTDITHEIPDLLEYKHHKTLWEAVVSVVLKRQKFYRYVNNAAMITKIAEGMAHITYDNPQLLDALIGKDYKVMKE